ncbi:Uncharacterised protein [Mycobacteroides abscessus subsp. abscessus]|nr:Uncharacterised protein [Mycobacteroides abscessus subsp. abscessus]
MCGIRAFISEYPVEFENLVETPDECLFQEKFRRNTQIQVDIKRVRMRNEGACGSTSGEGLQDRRLQLQEVTAVHSVTNSAHHRDTLSRDLARLGSHDEIHVALAHSGLFGHLLVSNGQRPEGLRCHLPAIRHHAQLAPARADDLSVHKDDVAEVHIGLPVGERLLADAGEADHHL